MKATLSEALFAFALTVMAISFAVAILPYLSPTVPELSMLMPFKDLAIFFLVISGSNSMVGYEVVHREKKNAYVQHAES
jgi:hypothetical protein